MHHSQLLMTMAFNKNNELVSIQNVENGHKCECYCPVCNAPLSARQGKIKHWSFAHQSKVHEQKCTWTGETELHLRVKDYLFKRSHIIIPIGIDKPYPYQLNIESIQLEKNMSGINRRPDLTITSQGEKIYLEVVVTNPCSREKIKDFKTHFANALEIDFSEFNFRDEVILDEDIREHLSDINVFKWLSITPAGYFGQKVNEHERSVIYKLKKKFDDQKKAMVAESKRTKDRLEAQNDSLVSTNKELIKEHKNNLALVNNSGQVSQKYKDQINNVQQQLEALNQQYEQTHKLHQERANQAAITTFNDNYEALTNELVNKITKEHEHAVIQTETMTRYLTRLETSVQQRTDQLLELRDQVIQLENQVKQYESIEEKIKADKLALKQASMKASQDRIQFERIKPNLKSYCQKTGSPWPFQFDSKHNLSIPELIALLEEYENLSH